jgi:23S rRNA-/tRNA-specific pseudouridylate synthase
VTQCFFASQGTTGVLVVARTKALARELSRQFRTHAVEKTYLALVRGDARRFPVKEGLITASLSFDDGRVRVVQAAAASGSGARTEPGPGGKAARTAWEVLASSVSQPMRRGSARGFTIIAEIYALHLHLCALQDVAPLSLVRLYPHTGLKHQLRVHMAHGLGGTLVLGSNCVGSPMPCPCSADSWRLLARRRHD